MSTEATTTTTPTDEEDRAGALAVDAAVLARAERTWRRAGVRSVERAAMSAELAGEVEAAATDGLPASAVLGGDVEATARAWAVERGAAGRSWQAATIVPVVVAAVVLGASAAVVEMVVTFYGEALDLGDALTPAPVTLAIWAGGAAAAVLLAVLGVWAALHHRGDPRAGATARWLGATVPLGGLAGLALVVAVGIAVDDGLAALPVMAAVFLTCCAGAGLAARHLATRYTPSPR